MASSYAYSQGSEDYVRYISQDAGQIATEFCDAWVNNNGKFDEDWFSDGFRFVTPITTFTGFAEFDRYFQEILPNFIEVDVANEFHNDDYYAWVFDITFADPFITLRIAQLMTFEDNQITEVEWIFDPREVLFRFNI